MESLSRSQNNTYSGLYGNERRGKSPSKERSLVQSSSDAYRHRGTNSAKTERTLYF